MRKIIIITIILLILLNLISCNTTVSDVEIGNYINLKLKSIPLSISKEEIDYEVNEKIKYYSDAVEVKDRNIVNKDDFIVINFKVYENNKLLNQKDGDILKIGAGFYDELLESELVNKDTNKEYEITIEYPEDYKTNVLKNKKLTYNIVIDRIIKYIKPEITDEFVSKKFGIETAEEFYVYIENNLKDRKTKINNETQFNKLIDEIINNSSFIINEKDVDTIYDLLIQNHKEKASLLGLKYDDYIKNEFNKDKKQFQADILNQSEFILKKKLIVEKIIELENIDVSREVITNIAIEYYNYANEALEFDINLNKATELAHEYLVMQYLFDVSDIIYSYDEFRAEMDKISNTVSGYAKYNKGNIDYFINVNDDKLKHLLESYSGVALDDGINSLVVFLSDVSEENINTFFKYITDFKKIKFEYADLIFIEQ